MLEGQDEGLVLVPMKMTAAPGLCAGFDEAISQTTEHNSTAATYCEKTKAALHTDPLIWGQLHVVDRLALLLVLLRASHFHDKLVDKLWGISVRVDITDTNQITYRFTLICSIEHDIR